MRLLWKIISRSALLAVLTLAAVSLAVWFFLKKNFSDDALRAVVLSELNRTLPAETEAEWIKLFPDGTVRLKGIKLRDKSTGKKIAEAENIYFRIDPLAALAGGPLLTDIKIGSPTLYIRKDGEEWNFGKFLKNKGQNGVKKLRTGTVEVIGGCAEVELSSASVRLYDIYFKAPYTDTEKENRFQTGFRFSGNYANLPFSGRVFTEIDLDPLSEENSGLSGFSGEFFTSSGTVPFSLGLKNFKRPELTLKARLPDLNGNSLSPVFNAGNAFTLPGQDWTVGINFSTSSRALIDIAAQPMGVKIDGYYDFSSAVPVYDFTVSGGKLDLSSFSGDINNPLKNLKGDIKADITVSSKGGSPFISGLLSRVKNGRFSYRNFSASGLDMTARISENFENSYIDIADGNLSLGKTRLKKINLNVKLSKEQLDFYFSGTKNGLPIIGRSAIEKPFEKVKKVYYTGYSKKLHYDEITGLVRDMKTYFSVKKKRSSAISRIDWINTLRSSIPSGYSLFNLTYKADTFDSLYATADNVYVTSVFTSVSGQLEKLKGTASVRTGAGTFFNVTDSAQKNRVYSVFSMPFRIMEDIKNKGGMKLDTSMKDVNFSSMGGDFGFGNGEINIKNFYLDGLSFSACMSGTVDFAKEQMNLKIYIISSETDRHNSLPQLLSDASGKPAMAFTITGNIAKPSIKMLKAKDSSQKIKEASMMQSGINFGKINRLLGGK